MFLEHQMSISERVISEGLCDAGVMNYWKCIFATAEINSIFKYNQSKIVIIFKILLVLLYFFIK